MKMALCGVHARLDVIVVTAPLTKASAFCLSRMSFGSSLVLLNGQGVSGCPLIATVTPPCMSLHWSGVINTNRGARWLFRSPASAVYGLMCATRAGRGAAHPRPTPPDPARDYPRFAEPA